LKTTILILPVFYLLIFSLSAQQTENIVHYYNIPEVTFIENNTSFFCDDYHVTKIDLNTLKLNNHNDLGNIFLYQTNANIKQYGPAGSLSSISLRGTGANHTQINWNGFPVNSPASGQTDLSLMPVGLMQNIEVINGASGALFGSGTFGGSVNMINKPDWNNNISVLYSFNGGSFETYNNLLSVKTGRPWVQYHLSFIRQNSRNNFPYTDIYQYGRPRLQREHNEYQGTGIIQNLFFNLPLGNTIEAGCWYQHKDIQLPAIMGNYQPSNANQKDSSLRSYIRYRKLFEKASLVFKSAYFIDQLRYTNKINATDEYYSTDSHIGTKRLFNETEYRYYWSEKIITGAAVSYNYLTGKSNNYSQLIKEHDFSISSFLKVNMKKWIGNAGLRKEFYDGTDPCLLYSLGWRYVFSDKLNIRTNVSNKFRKPTFNEKYWRPGGNTELKPEKGWGADASIEGQIFPREKSSSLNYTLTGFFQSVNNWIQWVTNDSLTPVEYKLVYSRGIEVETHYEYNNANIYIFSSVTYTLNRSTIMKTYDNNPVFRGMQLMYVPIHALKSNTVIKFGHIITGFCFNVTGKRETIESNNENLRLKGFVVADLMAGYDKTFRKFSLSAGFQIENLLNQQYEIIRSYPMPGRAYYIFVSFGWDKKKQITN
jgi:outer membrane cobalamin receptor